MFRYGTKLLPQEACAESVVRPSRFVRLIVLCVASLVLLRAASATTYYVSGVGHNEANGLSKKTAFRTLQHAADLTQPGDTVYIMDGEYSNTDTVSDGSVLKITRSGTPGHWITYKALHGQHPKISFNGWFGVSMLGSVSYIEVNGLTVIGNNDKMTLEGALKQGKVGDPLYNGNCIGSDGRRAPVGSKPTHLRILNNVVGKCGGGGIAAIQSDYVTIAGNTVYDSAWYNIYGCSGISVLGARNTDTNTGYKIVIVNNKVFGNIERVPWAAVGYISDGEGIIIDTFYDTKEGDYKGRTLIANNEIYNNGSSAIEILKADHVDIWNNSTYVDVRQIAEKGRSELGLRETIDSRIANNILYSAKGELPFHIDKRHPCGCALDANVYYDDGGGFAAPAGDAKALVSNPMYRNTDISNPWKVDLRLKRKSPALGSGVPFPAEAAAAMAGLGPIPTGHDRGVKR